MLCVPLLLFPSLSFSSLFRELCLRLQALDLLSGHYSVPLGFRAGYRVSPPILKLPSPSSPFSFHPLALPPASPNACSLHLPEPVQWTLLCRSCPREPPGEEGSLERRAARGVPTWRGVLGGAAAAPPHSPGWRLADPRLSGWAGA